jgi:hypothetical protein
MNSHDINKAYVSPYDQFLFEFDSTHAKTESQQKEIAKHARIARLRDNKQPPGEETLWEGF